MSSSSLDKKVIFTSRSERVKCVDFHPSEPWLLTSLYSGSINIWNYQTQSNVRTINVSEFPGIKLFLLFIH